MPAKYGGGDRMDIARPRYLEKLKDREFNGLVKIVTGVRRCGKSYLLFSIFYRYLVNKGIGADHIIQVDLERLENDALRDPIALYNHILSQITDDSPYYILIDEIQHVPRFSDVLNSLMHIRHADIYVTGSNSKLLSSDILTEFRGRGDEVRVYPLSFAEFCSVYDGAPQQAWLDYYTYGGMPGMMRLSKDSLKEQYLIRLFNETYLKDIIERHQLRLPADLDQLVNVLASAVGSLTNPKKLQDTFKTVKQSDVSYKTIASYIDCLKDAFLIEEAVRFDIKGRKYINSLSKYYYVDAGLRNARLNFRQIEETHLMENVIYNELRMREFNVDIGIIETRETMPDNSRIRKSLEIDFIARKGREQYYIQSALALPSAEKRAQEERPLLRVRDNFKKVIVVGTPARIQISEQGILTVNVLDFLLRDDILV